MIFLVPPVNDPVKIFFIPFPWDTITILWFNTGVICKDNSGLIDKLPLKSEALDGVNDGFLKHIDKKYYITLSQHSPI